MTLSPKELQGIDCTDYHDLIREAVEHRERYLNQAIQQRRQREAAIQGLNKTDRAAASYIAEHHGCTGDDVALAIHVSGEHFRRRIAPKLKPFGLCNCGGYFLPALRIL